MVRIQITISKDTATPLLERIKEVVGLAARTRLRLGARADYASYVEFGTRHSRAQPFIRPAVDGYFSQLVAAFRDGVLKGEILIGLEEAGSNMEMMAMSLCPVRTGFLRSTVYHKVG